VVKKNKEINIVIGLDASNLRRGGGITHLVELIAAAKPELHNIKKVIIWGSKQTLQLIDDKPWLVKITPKELSAGIIHRLYWQRFKFSKSARQNGCDLIFIPGGSFSTSFRPVVTMSRNMLPFEWDELKRYGFSRKTFRLILLKWLQSNSFKSASGVIFLTKYAEKNILKVTGNLPGFKSVISHGLNDRFKIEPKEQFDIFSYTLDKPFQLLYVSIVEKYKHQWHVVDAVAKLRKKGYPVELNLVGPASPSALKTLNKVIDSNDKNRCWVKYYGSVPYGKLHEIYNQSNLGIFASSCENMPNILLETMAAGLPIACSNRGPMPEVLGNFGLYFNPEKPGEIFETLETYLINPKLRLEKANSSFAKAQEFSWTNCANETLSFLNKVATYHLD
jgi:glycosyltransferase involved in cell wall biosynthesis